MKRSISLLAIALMFALTAPALAGGEQCAKEHAAKKAKMAAHGWLGIETEKDEASGAYRVTKVAAGSPAEQAGFQSGDVLVAFNGIPVKDKEKMKAAKASLGVGSRVSYTVARNGAQQQLSATLAPVPEEVLAKWVAEDEEAAKVAAKDN
ncbi:MAG TPA: PDZ domain-containing protein [Thermoanaerobaculia bacterium]